MSNTRSDNPKYIKQIPFKVKPSEKGRINLAFANITMDKKDGVTFKPVQGVTYLWVYTEKKEIVIGIEEAWKYPQAFIDTNDVKQTQDFERKIKPQLMASSLLGHVTLSCLFSQAQNNRGQAEPQNGKAFIGGELKFINGKWLVDNQSGRFGIINNTSKSVQLLMHEVVLAFESAMSFKPNFAVSLPAEPHLPDLYKIWGKGKTDVECALLILDGYATPHQSELILSGIWSETNNNLARVKKLLVDLKKDPALSVEKILTSFMLLLDRQLIENNKYLIRRLKFIAGQTNQHFKLSKGNEFDTTMLMVPLSGSGQGN